MADQKKWPHSTTLAFVFIVAIPLTGFTDSPLWQAAWIFFLGFGAGGFYQGVYNERERAIERELDRQIAIKEKEQL